MVSDPVQENLKKLIASKKKRGGARRAEARRGAGRRPSNVVNIMDALRKSISRRATKRG